ncbi:MAG: UDP-glucose/GDP-mannose dehydrogenase family protein [Candidatus Doudnabacteria bacterium]|nr:UDP-glucose/GDP-mannose dehydrogenase family protein [Candidatus Doudnabacteria bacterium]
MQKELVGIIGGGIVGSAVKNFFPDAAVYDKYKPMDSIEEVGQRRFIFICVPTPYQGALDLSIVDEAIANTVTHLSNPEDQLIVLKSTALPGTTDNYQKKYPDVNFAFNPEFLRDKTANEDFINNDRQIVGYTSKTKGSTLVSELAAILPPAPYAKLMRAVDAEMIKYAGNTFLALQVIFANQIFDICQAAGISYELVKDALKADKRIGKSHWEIFHTESSLSSNIGEAYRGYGGKCFPKDINSLIAQGRALGVDMALFEAGREINLELNGGRYDQ